MINIEAVMKGIIWYPLYPFAFVDFTIDYFKRR
mgnify:CR=1 FL=1